MSNEEYAQLIKEGREDLYPELWESVRDFVAWQANKRYRSTNGFGGVEADDLIQSGYLALVSAVSYYNPEDGYSFLTVLGNCLKTEFARAGGYRNGKREPLSFALSLDAPIGDPEDDLSLMDTIKSQKDVIGAIEEKVYTEQLHDALEAELNRIPEEHARAIRLSYFGNTSLEKACSAMGVSAGYYNTIHNRALRELRNPQTRKRLESFLDDNISYYSSVGRCAFDQTGIRSTEEKALQRIRFTKAFIKKNNI